MVTPTLHLNFFFPRGVFMSRGPVPPYICLKSETETASRRHQNQKKRSPANFSRGGQNLPKVRERKMFIMTFYASM